MNWISAAQYGRRLEPPIEQRQVAKYCKSGQIEGAWKMPGITGAWVIPEDAICHRNRPGKPSKKR